MAAGLLLLFAPRRFGSNLLLRCRSSLVEVPVVASWLWLCRLDTSGGGGGCSFCRLLAIVCVPERVCPIDKQLAAVNRTWPNEIAAAAQQLLVSLWFSSMSCFELLYHTARHLHNVAFAQVNVTVWVYDHIRKGVSVCRRVVCKMTELGDISFGGSTIAQPGELVCTNRSRRLACPSLRACCGPCCRFQCALAPRLRARSWLAG